VRIRGRVLPITIGLVLSLCTGRGTLWAADAAAPEAVPTKETAPRPEPQAQPRPVTSVLVDRIGDIKDDSVPTPFAVLYDQSTSIGTNATSQNFEAAYDAYDNQAADDFVVTAGAGWNVTTVFAPGAYSATHGSPASMRVTFFADAAGVPGAPICDFPALAFTEAPVGTFTINIPGGCILTAGTKWVSVVANLNFGGGGGQWFWSTRTVLTGNPSKWQNPGGGFMTPCATWGTRTTCLAGQTDPDMAYRLDGNIASCTVNADCADGNLCNGVETCTGGACQPGTPVNCVDGLQCTQDVCTPATGVCSHPPNLCSDGDSCTVDTCSEATGCGHTSPTPLHFCNAGSITIPSAGSGTPYPSPIVVSGLGTSASVCSVELLGLNHTFPDDIDILLSGPLGGASNAIIMSDVGGSSDVTGVNLTLKDAAATSLPDSAILTTGTFKPTNIGGGDVFAAPAPAPAGGSALSVFNGTDPNGTWRLFVTDQFTPDGGAFANGWCVNIVVSGCSIDAQCSDGNPCNGVETCVGGACQAGTPLICDDGLICTIDTCNPANGQCVFTADPCDDVNRCTADYCDEENGCQHANRCEQFCASGPITINDGTSTTPAPGTPYPSSIVVSGVTAPAQLASVEFLLSHTFPDDVDMLLVGPTAPTQNVVIFSDAGGGTDVTNAFVTISDVAPGVEPDSGPLVDGIYKPTNFEATDIFSAPAPAPSAATTLSPTFDGNPNGTWSLYVQDDAAQDTGSVGAWCVNILPPGCLSNAECDDSNPCTNDICASGGCFNTANTAACDDGNGCTVGDTCSFGSCNPGSTITPPSETTGLQVSPDKSTLTWTAAVSATSYDVVRGSTGAFPVGPGGGDEACFGPYAGPTGSDPGTPASGGGFWYLSRAKNSCGTGTYGSQSNATPRVTTTCP
jgi:hypothetical protein